MFPHAYVCIGWYKNSAQSIILELEKVLLLEVLLFSRIRSIYPKDNGLINVRWKLIIVFLWNTSQSLFQYRAVSLHGKP